jgi:hypothetical protein
MATFGHRSDIISDTRQGASKVLEGHAQLLAAKAAWDRGISQQIIDATGTDPQAVGYLAHDFAGHEGLVKADIVKALGVALDNLTALLMSADGKKFEDIAQ